MPGRVLPGSGRATRSPPCAWSSPTRCPLSSRRGRPDPSHAAPLRLPGDGVTSADRLHDENADTPSVLGGATSATPRRTGVRARRGSSCASMRPRQWSKNILVFVAPAAASVLGQWTVLWRVILAVLHLLRRRLGPLPHQRRARRRAGSAPPDQAHAARGERRSSRRRSRSGAGVALIAAGLVGAALVGPVGLRPRRGGLPRAERRLQPVAEAATRHGAGDRGVGVRAASRGRRRRRPRVPLDVVPRLHVVRGAVRRHGEALRRARHASARTGAITAASSTSTPSRSCVRR